jgi:tRNA(Ile)-lysidine synthetase-like protein
VVADLEARASADLTRLGRRDRAGITLDVAALGERPLELAVEILLQAAARQGETRPLRGPAQRALRRVLEASPRRRSARLGRLAVERSGRRLRVGPAALSAVSPRSWPVPGALELPEVGGRLTARLVARDAGYAVPREPGRVAFDADALPAVLGVRARRRGDLFSPFGGPAARRLKSFMIDAGIPRWARPRAPLIEAGAEIIWVAGVRRGSLAPVTAGTTRILELAFEVAAD